LSRKDVRAKDGRIISAFRFTGWQQGAIVTVIVAARVPPDGAPNVYVEPELAMTQKRLLRSVEFTRLTLRVGQSRPIDEMRALGLEPLFVRAEPRTPVQKQPNRQLPNHQFQ
jgi:hypothetical protein